MLSVNKILLVGLFVSITFSGCSDSNSHKIKDNNKKFDLTEQTVSFIKDKMVNYDGSLLGSDDRLLSITFNQDTCRLVMKSKNPRFLWIYKKSINLSEIDLYKTESSNTGLIYRCDSGRMCAPEYYDGEFSSGNFFQVSVSSEVQIRKIKKAFDSLIKTCQPKELF